ncbi:MAG: hypothetical protein EOP11_10205 [Proteobacteria bacterium]|nr:MAG: hypothetical protein EOP11_10205 [Pseudomonadota bacterium]
MKSLSFFLSLSLLPLAALAAPHADRPAGMPDLPPDAPSSAYRAHLSAPATLQTGWWGDDEDEAPDSDVLDTVLATGERNLKWLEFINTKRAEKLSFTSKETTRAYPIDAPNEYNPTIIKNEYEALKKEYPAALAAVVFDKKAFPEQPPLPVAEYIAWSFKLDRVYQGAARWRTMQGYLSYLTGQRKQDIRGYYYLNRLADRGNALRNYANLDAKKKAEIKDALVGVCYNGAIATVASCERDVNERIQAGGDLNSLYAKWEAKSAGVYNKFFQIPAGAARRGFRWETSATGTVFTTPFTDPGKEDVRRFLQDNIQDEWRFGNWKLLLPFTTANGAPEVVFEPGVTPHVNGLGGDTITMNASQPLTEYDAQWTIRHEFGHVLGLPDCYVEFYVPERKVIVNYQIDIDNIMCSRRGHVKQENVSELQKAYAN